MAAIQDARSFEHLPFHLLVANLSTEQRQFATNQHPIFNIFFNYRHNLDFPKIEISNVKCSIKQLTTNDAFDFAFTIDEINDNDNGPLITINYNANQYSNQLIDQMIAVYLKLLKSICSKNDCIQNEMYNFKCKMHHCDILSGSAIDIIKQQAIHTDKLIAFCNSYQTIITYQQLYEMIDVFSKQITQFYLQNSCENIRADTIIPICADSNAIIAPLLAVQLIGAAYAPIDPANSSTMIAQLVHDIGATIIIVQETNLNLNIPMLNMEQFAAFTNQQQQQQTDTKNWKMNYCNKKLANERMKKYSQSIDLSYVIFTSGTTGKPKAVCVTNQNLLNFIVASTQQTTFHPNYRIYHSVNTIFDVSCMNIFTTFSNGCCLISAANILNATNEIIEMNVQFAFLSAALFNMFDNDEINQLQQLEKLFVGGETINNQQINRCLQLGICLCQIYGPTETTIWSLTNNCTIFENECGRIIGTVINNEFAYVLDSENNLTCNGAKGELVICGNGITREDEILKRNLIAYYTGDFVIKFGEKYHFLGRKDKQLKMHGYRLEPTEIEIVVRKWDLTIGNVIVLKNEQLDSLVLFIEKETDSKYYCDLLRQYLNENLLHFMIPKKIILLQRMPLNRNGKIDVNKLNEMIRNDYYYHSTDNDNEIIASIQTNNVLQQEVQKIWCQLIGLSQINLTDNFFTIGGHSLLLILLRQKLRDKFNFTLNFQQFYRQPTLAALITSIQTELNICYNEKNDYTYQNYHLSVPLQDFNLIKFVNLRETVTSIGNVYMIHAIAGTIYSYFGLVSTIPQCFNIYAIEYELYYPSDSLIELATFYSKQ
ncbi:unnamed protein product, partial [Brugia timori]|uniref:Carrier domain-containing protein n=1 Tax=Brugia timori TaxID=42155 RepID=A0A0R3Q7P0_9BILA